VERFYFQPDGLPVISAGGASAKLSGGNSGGERADTSRRSLTKAEVQTLARPPGVSESREAFGLRMLQHRFLAGLAGWEGLRKADGDKDSVPLRAQFTPQIPQCVPKS
jgi:hypothetical protein